MKSKILVVGFACLSLTAAGQSNGSQNQASSPSQVKAPRDTASGQATGKRMHKPLVFRQDATAREAATGKATGKTMAHDDWQARTAKSSDTNGQSVSVGDVNQDGAADRSKTPPSRTGQTRVATGDVNGDGRADVAATKSSGHATEQNAAINTSHSNIRNAREAASGKATGRVAAGDVNGDGRADLAVSKSSGHATEQTAVINNSHSNIKNARDVASGQASGKRQHSSMTVVKDSDKAPKK